MTAQDRALTTKPGANAIMTTSLGMTRTFSRLRYASQREKTCTGTVVTRRNLLSVHLQAVRTSFIAAPSFQRSQSQYRFIIEGALRRSKGSLRRSPRCQRPISELHRATKNACSIASSGCEETMRRTNNRPQHHHLLRSTCISNAYQEEASGLHKPTEQSHGGGLATTPSRTHVPRPTRA
jgi:hypothetical protein